MSVVTAKVNGLTCQHCVNHVSGELKEIPGVESVNVDLVSGGTSTVSLTVDAGQVTEAQVREALDEAGDYELVSYEG